MGKAHSVARWRKAFMIANGTQNEFTYSTAGPTRCHHSAQGFSRRLGCAGLLLRPVVVLGAWPIVVGVPVQAKCSHLHPGAPLDVRRRAVYLHHRRAA